MTHTSISPFDKITGIQFSGMTYALNIRDDRGNSIANGRLIVTISLYAPNGQALIIGNPDEPHAYYEPVSGLVTRFEYLPSSAAVVITFSRRIVQESFGLTNLSCYVVTEGPTTVETVYNRYYSGNLGGELLKPGLHEIVIPYFRRVDQYFDNGSTIRVLNTQIDSSIPYNPIFRIEGGLSTALFKLSMMGVVWQPNANLTGWIGAFIVTNVCASGSINIPWQYPDIAPPGYLPTSQNDRVRRVYQNVLIEVALGACPGNWDASLIDVDTNFGYSGTIPYVAQDGPGMNATFNLGAYSPEYDRQFTRTYTLVQGPLLFTYDTEGTEGLIPDQMATLVRLKPERFDRMAFNPLSESP